MPEPLKNAAPKPLIASEETSFATANGVNSFNNGRSREEFRSALNPFSAYRGVLNRFFQLYKHVLGLIGGGILAHVNSLPDFKKKGLRSPGSRTAAFLVRPFVKKSLRDLPFAAQLRRRLELLGPTYIKLGQIMAIREDILPKNITDELENLLDRLPAVPFEVVEKIIEDNLGVPWQFHFRDIEREAIGSASIGQTHRATLRSGEKVIIKVIKPGIRETILSDIKLLKILGHFLEWIIGRYQPQVIIDEFCRYTEKEIDMTYEADHAELFTANFANIPDIVFPKIYHELSTRDILCMEFLDGMKPNDPRIREMSQEDQHKIIDAGTGAIIKMLYEDGFFHADLHAGNLLVLPGPKVGFIDLGMVGRFDENVRLNMLYYFYSLVSGDIESSTKYLLAMATVGKKGDPVGFNRSASDILRRYRLQASYGNYSLAQLIMQSVALGGKYRIFFPVEMTLMVKALVTFEGVGRHLDPNLDVPALSRKHIRRVYSNRYDPQYLMDMVLKGLPELVDVIIKLPGLVADSSRWLDRVVNAGEQPNPLEGIKSSLIAGSCIVGGVVAFVQGASPILWVGLFVSSVLFFLFGK